MFRNMYGKLLSLFITLNTIIDSDAATWSPQGRLHQVEYAIEAIKVHLINTALT